MTQNIYGLTRNNTRPRGVQFILSGSKQFRKNGGPHLKGSRRPRKKVARPLLLRRPQVVFFGAQAEKKRFFFSRRRLVMVFGGQITFSTPQKNFRPLQFFFAPHFFFSVAFFFFSGFFFFRRPKPKIGFFGGRRRSKGLKVAFWVQPPYEPLAVKIVLRGSNGFRVFRGTHLEGPRRLRMKGS